MAGISSIASRIAGIANAYCAMATLPDTSGRASGTTNSRENERRVLQNVITF
jgi:hypothetical protein